MMTTWYSIDLDDSKTAQNTTQKIMDAFLPKYIGAGRPIAMAIFSSYNSALDRVTVYFSPKAISLAIQFGASPCESDFINLNLSLLVGDERSIDHLFPDAQAE